LVHYSSRATSSLLHNNAKIFTKITSLHTQTHSRINLEPYKIASTPYTTPYHIRCTILAKCRTLLLCLMQTIQPKRNQTRLQYKLCLKPYLSTLPLRSEWYTNYKLQNSITAAKNQSIWRRKKTLISAEHYKKKAI